MLVGRPAGRARSLPFEVVAVAILFAVVSAEIVVTYSRLPAHELYDVSRSGLAGGGGRLLVFLNYPTALVAVAVLTLIAPRLRDRVWTAIAAAGVALSAAVLVPGVVDAVGERCLGSDRSRRSRRLHGHGSAYLIGVLLRLKAVSRTEEEACSAPHAHARSTASVGSL